MATQSKKVPWWLTTAIGISLTASGGVIAWSSTMSKTEARVSALEQRQGRDEKQQERIEKKLDQIQQQVNQIYIVIARR